jgi:hypothetical protein
MVSPFRADGPFRRRSPFLGRGPWVGRGPWGNPLGPERRAAGAIGIIGTATAATFNTATGVGTATRVDVSNQSYVEWTGLRPSGQYQIAYQNTGAAQMGFRTGSGGAILLTVNGGVSGASVIAASSGGVIIVAAINNGSTASFTVSSIREVRPST